MAGDFFSSWTITFWGQFYLLSDRPKCSNLYVTNTILCSKFTHNQFLGSFAKSQKPPISFVKCARPSVCPHGRPWPPLEGFAWNMKMKPFATHTKSRGQLLPVHTMKAYRGTRGVGPRIPSLGSRWRRKINVTPLPHCRREWTVVTTEENAGWARAGLGLVRREKSLYGLCPAAHRGAYVRQITRIYYDIYSLLLPIFVVARRVKAMYKYSNRVFDMISNFQSIIRTRVIYSLVS